MQDLLKALHYEGQAFSVLEIIAVISAVLYVILVAKGNRWCFLFGLISSLIYISLSLFLKFYFDTAINIYYVFMSFYGWIAWSSKKNSLPLTPSKISQKLFLTYSIIGLIVSVLLAFIVSKFSDAVLPYFDAFTTVFAIIATYMVVKKWIENWIIWIVVDFVATGMYWHKELYLTALLFVFYTIISFVGYFNWKKQIN